MLFEPETYRTISKKDNLIAFVFEIPLLLRVLKAAGNNAADSLEVKLAMRTLSSGPSTQPVSRPYLTFASKGHNLNMTQDLPVSKPYTAGRKSVPGFEPCNQRQLILYMQLGSYACFLICMHVLICLSLLHAHKECRRQKSYTVIPSKQNHSGKAVAAEIDELNGIKDVTQLCLFYLDLQGEVQRLQVSLHAHIIHADLQPIYPLFVGCTGNCRQDEGHLLYSYADYNTPRRSAPPGDSNKAVHGLACLQNCGWQQQPSYTTS